MAPKPCRPAASRTHVVEPHAHLQAAPSRQAPGGIAIVPEFGNATRVVPGLANIRTCAGSGARWPWRSLHAQLAAATCCGAAGWLCGPAWRVCPDEHSRRIPAAPPRPAPCCPAVLHVLDGGITPRTPLVEQYERGEPISSINLTAG